MEEDTFHEQVTHWDHTFATRAYLMSSTYTCLLKESSHGMQNTLQTQPGLS